MENDFRIKQNVADVNKALPEEGLCIQTWGNASAIDKDRKHILIKSSGVPFKHLKGEDISEVDLDGKTLTPFKPSVDTPTHIEIYKAFEKVGGIIHTHSHYATIFAQARLSIPCLGTTHADHFAGDIPIMPDLSEEEVKTNYEQNTGKKIVSFFKEKNIDPLKIPGILIPSHGVFVFGETINKALDNAIALEAIAKMAYETLSLSKMHGKEAKIDKAILDKHFERKHGEDKYYGQ